jgi:urease accessory protein
VNNSCNVEQNSHNWHGNLNLVYAQHQGKTQVIHSQMKAPLKVQRPFYPEGGVCHSVVLHTAGGIVGGDRNHLSFHLQPNAQALITTATASKIYRSNGLQSIQRVQMQVDTDACLEWLPQETIVFDGAVYRQDLQVELAPGAKWLGWEITRFGRTARGERFLHGDWKSYTEVWQQGIPLWIDRQWLPGGEKIIDSPHGLAGFPIVGSLAWIGQEVEQEIVEKARVLFANNSSSQGGVTRLPMGLLCRYRGSSTTEVRNWFTEIWQLLRSPYLNRSICPPRVWQR